jgi:hypothetical protein
VSGDAAWRACCYSWFAGIVLQFASCWAAAGQRTNIEVLPAGDFFGGTGGKMDGLDGLVW